MKWNWIWMLLPGCILLFLLAEAVLPGFSFDAPQDAVWAGLILWGLEVLLRPLLVIAALPINLFIFGIGSLFIHVWLVYMAAAWAPGYEPGNFWGVLAAGACIMLLERACVKMKEIIQKNKKMRDKAAKVGI